MAGENIPNSTEKELTIGDALARIHAIGQRIQVTGAVDSEPGDFQRIIADLKKGNITPEQAVQKAEGVEGSRYDYH